MARRESVRTFVMQALNSADVVIISVDPSDASEFEDTRMAALIREFKDKSYMFILDEVLGAD